MQSNEGAGGPAGPSRDYAKPMVVAIELKADEVLGYSCKTALPVGGPNVGTPNCGIGNGCVSEGS